MTDATPTLPPTGRRETRGLDTALVFNRDFAATPAEVWAALTEPALLERWIGTLSGDPLAGTVVFRMTAEGEDVPEEPVTITDCAPRERLALQLGVGDGAADPWRLEIDLAAHDAGTGPVGTTLTFAQLLTDPSGVGDIAPGWEYYLDRLAAVLRGADVEAVRFEHYHPGQSEHYRAMFS
ncbi:SRPBCC domain-containing protein [Herbiconiux sp. CPCC 203407]|uniref:SRPBCC domain-containing protein n=1 Tax=Herbiconiux oxytropis TaxID=2970915 RepID=A0AA41XHH0_9MICO|nr:SRPBCC domain-containing protein [Herbiconiux oxytropis]MCS5722895.1 SRPBCC domain-containing protein [Herbiconiux oxytropis]MCS5725845.1 SRPBCC domain-containing protein [Herbiconiux oxytropis]